MTIPSKACAPLINTIQATTTAAIRTVEDIPPAQVMVTIRDQDQVRDRALVPTAARDLGLTAMTIITAANHRSCSEFCVFAAMFVDANVAALSKNPKPHR
jgi:hypothetical protein